MPTATASLTTLRGVADGRNLTGESLRNRARRWREQAAAVLVELDALAHAIALLEPRCFEGDGILFTDGANALDELPAPLTDAIELFNRSLATRLDHYARLRTARRPSSCFQIQ